MEYPRPPESPITRGLRACPIFAGWPDRQLQELAALARLRDYTARTQVAPLPGGPQEVLIVTRGALEVCSANAAGKEFLLGAPGPGQVVGLVHLQESMRKLVFTHHARKGAQIIHLPIADLQRLLDADPLLWRHIALFVLRRFQLQTDLLQTQAIGSTRRRMAVMLALLAQHYGAADLDAPQASLQISQTDLAHMLGLSRQTVAKELAQLRSEGVLGGQDGYSQILVRDLPGLLRIADDL
ncbi:MAG: Crp/Fnr family transcriptional regulator [Acidovorax sp.]